MIKRPAPLNRAMDGMLPAERQLAVHVMLATGDWPRVGRANLIGCIIAALDEAYQKGIDATIEANSPVPAASDIDAPPEIEAFARAALVFDAGGGP